MQTTDLVKTLRALITEAAAPVSKNRLDFSKFEEKLLSLGVKIQIVRSPESLPSISYEINGQKISGYHLGENSRYMLCGLKSYFEIELAEELLQVAPANTVEPRESLSLRLPKSQKECLVAMAKDAGKSANEYLISLIRHDQHYP